MDGLERVNPIVRMRHSLTMWCGAPQGLNDLSLGDRGAFEDSLSRPSPAKKGKHRFLNPYGEGDVCAAVRATPVIV